MFTFSLFDIFIYTCILLTQFKIDLKKKVIYITQFFSPLYFGSLVDFYSSFLLNLNLSHDVHRVQFSSEHAEMLF